MIFGIGMRCNKCMISMIVNTNTYVLTDPTLAKWNLSKTVVCRRKRPIAKPCD
jgi:hypothetical protein